MLVIQQDTIPFLKCLETLVLAIILKKKRLSLLGNSSQTTSIPQDKLWVTIHHEDDESYDIWLNLIGVEAQRIIRCGDKDNFWSMGDTGPCGPCTEIFMIMDQRLMAVCQAHLMPTVIVMSKYGI